MTGCERRTAQVLGATTLPPEPQPLPSLESYSMAKIGIITMGTDCYIGCKTLCRLITASPIPFTAVIFPGRRC